MRAAFSGVQRRSSQQRLFFNSHATRTLAKDAIVRAGLLLCAGSSDSAQDPRLNRDLYQPGQKRS